MKTILISTLTLATVSGVGFGLASRGSSDNGSPRHGQLPVTVEWVAANGTTEGPREELPLRAEVAGTIRFVNVYTNQDVSRGTVLVELDNGVQQAQVKRAEAKLANAQANLERLLNGERPARRQAVAAAARSREADYNKALDAYERLRRSGTGASAGDVRQAETALNKARADWEASRAEHDLIEAPPRQEDVNEARARASEAEADLEQAQAELAKTRLKAPWDARVLRIYSEPGALVGPNSTRPILILADASRRQVRAFVDENDQHRIRQGQESTVTVDGMPGLEFRGRVRDVLLRMDREGPRSEAPGEYQDIYHRPVVIDLEGGLELPLNLRVQVRIAVTP